MKDFYPIVLATVPPKLVTRKDVEDYYRKRGTICTCTHIPATNPRDEGKGGAHL
jgi:hypothetical protein